MDYGLSNRVALVTGGSQGIGRAAVEQLRKEGARVALTYHKNVDIAQTIVSETKAAGGDALAVYLDLGSLDSIRQAVDLVVSHWGGIDIVVNNAIDWGQTPGKRVLMEAMEPDEWIPLFRTNIEGTYAVMQAVIPLMRKQSWGRIVNVSSTFAMDGMPRMSWYSTAKAALHGMTRSVFRELAALGIFVNVVMPGLTLTETAKNTLDPNLLRYVAHASPTGRLLLPEDIASTIVFLCSAANTAITGEIIRTSAGA